MENQRLRGVALAVATAALLALPQLAQAKPAKTVLTTPANGATVDTMPSFGWLATSGADHYEFQISSTADFSSPPTEVPDTVETRNIYATVAKNVANGMYYWHVRAVDKRGTPGAWSIYRVLHKSWAARVVSTSPANGSAVVAPAAVVLRWSSVRYAYRYHVVIGTDPSLATAVVDDTTSSLVYAPLVRLSPGAYYWRVWPIDAEKHEGSPSALSSFTFVWNKVPQNLSVADVWQGIGNTVYDPQFSWSAVAGASRYEVQVATDPSFLHVVHDQDKIIGTHYTPTTQLGNDTYYWRVRAFDGDNASGWALPNPLQFDKPFDSGDGSSLTSPVPVPNLHMLDSLGTPQADSPSYTTSTPILGWDPVPGASSYRVEVTPKDISGCDWTLPDSVGDHWTVYTAATAWTPLGYLPVGTPPKPFANYGIDGKVFNPGQAYCARVTACQTTFANCEIYSPAQQLNVDDAAFTFSNYPTVAGTFQAKLQASDYLLPLTGSFTTTPRLLTWSPTPGANSYWVVVANDPNFTNIVDVALTNVPAYAPRGAAKQPVTYPLAATLGDTSYYWGVVPAVGFNGDGASATPQSSQVAFPHFSFTRTSVNDIAITSPGDVNHVESGTPTFRWTPVIGARSYRVEVATDGTFGNIIDTETTAATALTSLSTYPADTSYYWRVVALDELGKGLAVSPTGQFRKVLPAPVLSAANQKSGDVMTDAERWTPVNGAVAYDVHIVQANGFVNDTYGLRQPAFAFVKDYGTGISRWQVRAQFPSGSGIPVTGPWTPLQTWTHSIPRPTGPVTNARGANVALVGWQPQSAGVKRYRVQISSRQDFAPLGQIDVADVDSTSFAPFLEASAYRDGGTLWWRVASIDEGDNQGPWTAPQRLALSRAMRVQLLSYPLRGQRAKVKVQVLDPAGNAVAGAKVLVYGAGVRRVARRTNRSGLVSFALLARRRGALTFRVTRAGYQATTLVQQVY
jgi:hypothetical protein